MQLSTYDVDYIRSNFPILKRKINGNQLVYFDNAASAQKPQVVIDAVSIAYSKYYSNVHRGVHELSQEATNAFEAARETCRVNLNAKRTEEIIFTSGTTQNLNLLAFSLGELLLTATDTVITTYMEHHANIVPWQMACERKKAKLVACRILDNGELDLDHLNELLAAAPKVLTLTHVSNVLGTINPLKQIIKLAHEKGTLVVVDGAQAIPHMSVNVQELDVDFYTYSGHKVFGPTGTGILYGKKALLEKMPPYLGGGNMINRVSFSGTTYNDLPHKFEAGTPNIAGFIGLAAALDFVSEIGHGVIEKQEWELLSYLNSQLEPIEGINIQGTSKKKAAVVSLTVNGIHPFDLGTLLNEYGIAVRTGHHCCQPIMDRYNISSSLRTSLSFYNTKAEIDFFIEKLYKVIKML